MEKAFISYAREDAGIVHRLQAALEERGRKTWVDKKDIPPTDKWLATIHSAIEEADACVFVISPDSIASEVCGMELDHAIKHHKRLIPVMYHEGGTSSVRQELAEINYIFFRESDDFDIACDTLVTALNTDLPWIRDHTRLLVRGIEWEREGGDSSYTLRGRDLDYFEQWLARSPDKEPRPTTLQTEYLLASRRAVTRRRRIVAGSVAVGLSIAVGLATIAYFLNRERARQETVAAARQLLNKADALRDGPSDERFARIRLEQSTRAAAMALATFDTLGMRSLEADQAMRKSLAALPKWFDVPLDLYPINASAFDATGAYLAVFWRREQLMVWDTAHRQEVASCTHPLMPGASALAVAVTNDARLAATVIYDSSPTAGDTEITVWSIADCRPLLRLTFADRVERVALSGSGNYLVVDAGARMIRSWNVATGSEISGEYADLVFAFASSPDGARLATVERNRGESTYWIRIRDLASGQLAQQWEHPERAAWIQWRPNALAVGDEKAASIYAPESAELVRRHPIDGGRFVTSPDGKLLASALANYVIQIRDAATGEEVARTSHDREPKNFAFSPDNQSLITIDEGRRIRLWFFEGDAAFATLSGAAPVERVEFSRDISHLYAGGVQGVSSWRLPRAGEFTAPQREDDLDSVAGFSERYRIEFPVATGCGSESTTLTLHPQGADSEPRTIEVDAPAWSAAASRDGARIAVLLATASTRGGCSRRLEVWNVETHSAIAQRDLEPLLDTDAATFLQFGGEDRYLFVGSRLGIEIVDANQLTSLATLFHSDVTLSAVNSDGSLAATMDRPGHVRIWNPADQTEIARIESSPRGRSLALSSDGRWLATLEGPATIRLWALAPDDLIQQACRWLPAPCP